MSIMQQPSALTPKRRVLLSQSVLLSTTTLAHVDQSSRLNAQNSHRPFKYRLSARDCAKCSNEALSRIPLFDRTTAALAVATFWIVAFHTL